jgi:protease-4
MLKKIFMTVILLLAVLSFVVSLLGGKNNSAVKQAEDTATRGDKIAVIDITGTMLSGGSGVPQLFSETTGAYSNTIMKQLRRAAKDKNVKAVLLNINSPGGSVTSAEEITEEIQRFKKDSKKPIVATMGNAGASAAYYVAANCDKIYANPSTLTGSIGVYIGSKNLEELYKKLGITDVMIKSGVHKDILSGARPMTAEERTILQSMVDEMFESFLQTVSIGRKLPLEQVRALADGRVYTGRQAKNLKLVDELGNYYDALAGTAELAKIEGEPSVVKYDSVQDWRSWFSGQLAGMISARVLESLQLPADTAVWHKG